MANTVTLTSFNNFRLTYLVACDGSGTTYTYTQAQLAADCATLLAKFPNSPLPAILTQTFATATQAAMRAATIDGGEALSGTAGPSLPGAVKMYIRPRNTAAPAAVANAVDPAIDVTPDVTSGSKLSLTGQCPSTAAVDFYLDLVFPFSMVDG